MRHLRNSDILLDKQTKKKLGSYIGKFGLFPKGTGRYEHGVLLAMINGYHIMTVKHKGEEVEVLSGIQLLRAFTPEDSIERIAGYTNITIQSTVFIKDAVGLVKASIKNYEQMLFDKPIIEAKKIQKGEVKISS